MKLTNLIKLLLVVLSFATIVWLGGSILRAVIAYSIFVPATELELKPDQTDELRMNVVKIYVDTAIYTIVSFVFVFVITLFLLFKFLKHLKIYGWLFMAFVLFFIASPIELYLIFLDIKLILYLNYTKNLSFQSYEVSEFFINRLRKLNIISPLAYLSFFTSIILLIFRPLDKSNRTMAEKKE